MKTGYCEENAKLAGLNKADIEKLLEIAKESATKGGEVLMDHYGKIKSIESKSTRGDLVTNADLESEELVIKILESRKDGISILAEESGLKGPNTELCWCIDPLDGTTNFAHGYPFFATSIGLTWKDKPILGAISIPFINETYYGAPGIGVFCNKNRVSVSNTKSMSDSLLVTGFAYDRQSVKDNNYAEFCTMTHKSRGVRRGGAAAVDLAFIAAGRLDGYWERGLAPWDLAAGVALVDIAGGHISDYKSEEFDLLSGRILACTPYIQSELKNELKKVRPLDTSLYC